MRPDYRRWLLRLRADLGRSSCEFRRCRVWPGQSHAAGSRRNLQAWALPGAVEWWVSRSRATAVIGGAGRWSLRWPAGSLGYKAGIWIPGGAGFSTAPLRVPGRFPQASVRPSPPSAHRGAHRDQQDPRQRCSRVRVGAVFPEELLRVCFLEIPAADLIARDWAAIARTGTRLRLASNSPLTRSVFPGTQLAAHTASSPVRDSRTQPPVLTWASTWPRWYSLMRRPERAGA
jgi:hypothetical protein